MGGGGNAAASAAANSAKVERVVEDPKWILSLHFNYPEHFQSDLVSIMVSRADRRLFQETKICWKIVKSSCLIDGLLFLFAILFVDSWRPSGVDTSFDP